jgi:hypothetical protein
MAEKVNPFVDVPDAAHAVFETLFGQVIADGSADWVWDLIYQWRVARGEKAKDSWEWWTGPEGCSEFEDCHLSRPEAIGAARIKYAMAGRFDITEARDWSDEFDVEDRGFAEQRNQETIWIHSLPDDDRFMPKTGGGEG